MAVYTAIDDPSAHFQVVLYTGNQTARSITNDGNSDLQPDWVWDKNRANGSYHHNVYDSSRGTGKQLRPNTNDAEISQAQGVTAFNSDGFSLGTDDSSNKTNDNYVAWQWKANGGTRTTFTESGANPAGGYQANTTAGFSIVDYTGTGSSGATIAHGLGAVPAVVIVKSRSIGDSWTVYHHKNTSAPETDMIKLDETGATQDNIVFWNDTAPTSSVFTVDGGNGEPKVNQDAATYIAYVWTEIQGYSRFGSYEGNGNADGPFVYTGFKPAYIIIKNIDASGNWTITDNAREPTNDGADTVSFADVPDAEASGYAMDKLSNGFKVRNTGSARNTDAQTYVYAAFAAEPFVTSTGIPATAV